MTLEERAQYIAELANECCGRSDGYAEDIYKATLTMLQEVRDEARQKQRQNVIAELGTE